MNFVWKERLRRYWPQVLGTFVVAIVGGITTLAIFAASTNATVDFSKPLTTVAPYAFSGTISTYGNQGTIVNSAKQRTNLNNLGLGSYRIPLQWNNGNPVSSAEGAAGGPSGDAWITKIREIGAEPMVVLGGSQDNNFSAQDAANMVRHYSGANKVTYWVIGNEPDNRGIGMAQYCNTFNAASDAMKAVDPSIKIIGPALTDYEDYKYADYDAFLKCAGSRVDIVDFHDYGERTQNLAYNVSSQAERYEGKVKDLRARIQRLVPNRAANIEIQIGEWNVTPIANGDLDDRMYSGGTTVYGALAAGNIAKAGARGHQYSDQNNPLGLTFESQSVAANFGKTIADPMPLYHGIGMFTGEKLFRGFGKQFVETTSDNANVSLYASTNDKNIVLINKGENAAENAAVKLTGFTGGTAEIWQTNKAKPFDAPVKKATIPVKDIVEYELPAWTVTTVVLHETGTPAPTPPPPTPNPTTPTPHLETVPLRINVGGGQYTDPSGAVWKADMYATGGSIDSQAAGRAIANTTMDPLYQDERWGTFSYRLPITKGNYKVRLHFAEIYNGCAAAGCRTFSATAEGVNWLNNYDIVAKTGANTAIVEEKVIALNDDTLDLSFAGLKGSAQLAGIEVLAASTPTVPSPVPAPAPAAGGLSGEYFANKTLSGSSKVRTDATIDFNWATGAPMSNIPADNFSVRWTGSVAVPKTGAYTFYLTGDDGVRMWVNGKQIINGWQDQSAKEYQATVQLDSTKRADIKVEYYENGGDAVSKLAWSGPELTRQIVPASVFSNRASGLKATYYAYSGNGQLGNTIASATTETVNFAWKTGQPQANVPADRFGATWAGTITAPITGTYTLTTESDDGVRVWVDDKLVIDNWSDHSLRQDSASVMFEANKARTIKLAYYENGGDATMRFLWKAPGQATATVVPATALSY
jgi:hypothetical protein